jgi:hypothetical protein
MAQDLSAVPLGRDASINRNTGAAFGTVTWVAIANIQDVTLNSDRAKGDVSVRGVDFKQYVMGQKDVSVSFSLVFVRADAGYTALLGAHVAGTPIQLAVLDGPAATAGSYGLNADWHVNKFARGEPVDDGIKFDVELCMAKTVNAPAVITIAGS